MKNICWLISCWNLHSTKICTFFNCRNIFPYKVIIYSLFHPSHILSFFSRHFARENTFFCERKKLCMNITWNLAKIFHETLKTLNPLPSISIYSSSIVTRVSTFLWKYRVPRTRHGNILERCSPNSTDFLSNIFKTFWWIDNKTL